jgi:hypothetical protein
VPVEGLQADFADDGSSVVVWDDTGTDQTVLVDLAAHRQVTVVTPRRPARVEGFRAVPSGAAELWGDGTVTLVDRDGAAVQELGLHSSPVQDVVVGPDGTWAVTADAGGWVVRWDVDPPTSRWSLPEVLAGHNARVVGVEVAGDTVVTVSRDHAVLSWRMGPDGAAAAPLPADPEGWLRGACAVVGRDLDPAEWRRFLPDRAWRPTCTDLG